MTFTKSNALVTRLGRPVRDRVALVLSYAISDSQIRPQVVPFGSSKIKGSALEDFFEILLEDEECRQAWEAYTDVTTITGFPQQLAQGTAPLNGFRHYLLQDAIYLEYYVRVRMAAIATWDSKVSSEELWDFVARIPNSLNYSASTRSVCEYQLGIPGDAIDEEWNNNRSEQLQASVRHYEDVIANAIGAEDNSWLDIHFALLPCIKGYYVIFKALLQDTTTVRNTPYYSLWIETNADGSYVEKYDAFINDNIGSPTAEQWTKWRNIFKKACINEKNFFDLAIEDYGKYDIVKEANYQISPFVNGATFLASDGEGGVTISDQPVQWQLINSRDGYSIQLGDQQFLGVDGQSVVIKSDESTKWSINPVFIPEKNTYQLFLSGRIQHALDFGAGETVSVANSNLTTQTWILTEV